MKVSGFLSLQRDPILAKQLFSSLFAGILQEMEKNKPRGESAKIKDELRVNMNTFLSKSSLCFPPFIACVQVRPLESVWIFWFLKRSLKSVKFLWHSLRLLLHWSHLHPWCILAHRKTFAKHSLKLLIMDPLLAFRTCVTRTRSYSSSIQQPSAPLAWRVSSSRRASCCWRRACCMPVARMNLLPNEHADAKKSPQTPVNGSTSLGIICCLAWYWFY